MYGFSKLNGVEPKTNHWIFSTEYKTHASQTTSTVSVCNGYTVPGNRVEADEPLGPFKSPQLTGGLWEIDTGDYSGLAGLAVAAHDIIDDFDDDFAESFEYAGSSIAWLFVAAGALILLAAGIWCARAQLARWNGHGRRGGLKTKARELGGSALPSSRTGGARSRGTTASRRRPTIEAGS